MSTDWTKPVYDRGTGTEVWALRRPDGSVHQHRDGSVRVITADGDDTGWWSPDNPDYTNTPPVQDWSTAGVFRSPDARDPIVVRFGRRNGKLFAEVVE